MDLQKIVSQVSTMCIQLSLIYIPLLIGCFAKEAYPIFIQNKKKKINAKNILLTATTLSFVLVGIIQYFIDRYNFSMIVSGLFIIGASSGKFIGAIFDGRLLKIMLKFLAKSKGTMEESIQSVINDDKTNKK